MVRTTAQQSDTASSASHRPESHYPTSTRVRQHDVSGRHTDSLSGSINSGNQRRKNRHQVDAPVSIVLNRLIDASRQAAYTTSLARDQATDPDFEAWLNQLIELHESSVLDLTRVLKSQGYSTQAHFNLRSWLRRCVMRCSPILSETADYLLIDLCRREEYCVQSAYEHALWVLPASEVRDTVEDLFQQFVLHRSMIPTRRLPQTRQFLEQADRLQRIHSPTAHEDAHPDSTDHSQNTPWHSANSSS